MKDYKSLKQKKFIDWTGAFEQESVQVDIETIMKMIGHGEEPRRIIFAIAECATNLDKINGCGIFLPSIESSRQEFFARYGKFNVDSFDADGIDSPERAAMQPASQPYHIARSGNYNFDVVCVGAPIGTLAIATDEAPSEEISNKLCLLAHLVGIVFERQRLSGTLQHFLDRLEALNTVNEFIASHSDLDKMAKSIAKEGSFRFNADVVVCFVLDEETELLEAKGKQGCAQSILPRTFDPKSGIIGEVMKMGGQHRINGLKTEGDSALSFLEELEIKSLYLCNLEARGESLGLILYGFKKDVNVSQNDLVRYEEYCQAAAFAIVNARTQERVSAYTERLEELVEKRTEDLAIESERAEEANKAKSQFLANMSHELRAPLTAIMGYASVLNDGVFGELTEKQKEAIVSIARSGGHLKELIDDVLNLARIESGKEEAKPNRVSVSSILPQAHKIMLQTAVRKGVTVEALKYIDDAESSFAFVDSKHLYQIIINLMSNAVKYTPAGGKINVEVSVEGEYLQVSVHDTGIGIPQNKLDKLFERFERGDDHYSQKQEGTGIGLHLTKKLVELNQGSIGVKSTVNVGSTFWIQIPLATSCPISEAPQESTEQATRLDGTKILVVDDNIDTCKVLQTYLEAAGAIVRDAQSVKDGIAAIDDTTPDIILTDLAIPEESGMVLIQKMKGSTKSLQEIPIIVLSACVFEQDKQAALEAGASTFIAKPFRPSDVLKAVASLVPKDE